MKKKTFTKRCEACQRAVQFTVTHERPIYFGKVVYMLCQHGHRVIEHQR